jgi:Fic family protein
MKIEEFSNPAGNLIPTIEKQLAFVPAALPPQIDLAAVAMSMSNAMQAVGELKGACRRLQNPYILVRPLQRQEALTSSAMEGTFTTDDRLLRAEAGVAPDQDESTQEVVNYLNALNESLSMLRTLPISHRVIRQAHQMLLSNLTPARGANKRPGEYKQTQNWIGGLKIENARYIPPPPAETQICMDSLESYINREVRNFPTPLMDLALVHYQIEAIHPFADGNGRVGRMLISLMAIHSGLLDMPVLYISPVMEKHKDQYIDLMYNVSARGQWSEWLNFFFDRVAESCRDTVGTVDRLIYLQSLFRQKASELGRTTSTLTLVDFLFEQTVISVNDAKDKLKVTYAAARTTIDKLVSVGILAPITGTYPMLFYAPAIRHTSQTDATDWLASNQLVTPT